MAKRQKNTRPVEEAETITQNALPKEGGLIRSQSDGVLIAIILTITFLIFLNSVSGQFLYDDWYQIERNPSIRSWSFLSSVFSQHVWEFANSDTNVVGGLYYRPIFNLTLLINYQLFGLGVVGWHMVSIVFHLVATAMVFKLARLWTLTRETAAFAAIIFGLHPIHVEAVAWASALPDLMLGVFVLASLVLYEKYRRDPAKGPVLFWASILLALLAAGVKETGVVLPLFILVREVIDREPKEAIAVNLRRNAFRLGIYISVAALYIAARYAVVGFITKTNPLAEKYTQAQSLLTIPYIFVQYLRTIIVGYPLSYIYDYRFLNTPTEIRFWGSLIIAGIFCWLVYKYAASRPVALKAAALFVIFLLPVFNLRAFSPAESLAHDRYLYLPSAGFILLAAMMFESLLSRINGSQRRIAGTAALALIVTYGALTFNQNKVWISDTVLTEHAISLSPDWAFLHIHLGEVYAENGRMAEAESEMKRAIELEPDWGVAYSTLGHLLAKQGRSKEAEALFKEAVRHGQKDLTTQNNMAASYIQEGKIAEAKEVLTKALAQSPENPIVNYNAGLLNEKESKLDAAEQYYLKAISKDPSYVDPRVALAGILVRQNRMQQAFEQISAVRALAPENTDVLFSLAGAYLQLKQCDKAVEPSLALTSSLPNSARAHVMLGLSYECLGQKDGAIASFRWAVEVGPQEQISEVAKRHLEQLGSK